MVAYLHNIAEINFVKYRNHQDSKVEPRVLKKHITRLNKHIEIYSKKQKMKKQNIQNKYAWVKSYLGKRLEWQSGILKDQIIEKL